MEKVKEREYGQCIIHTHTHTHTHKYIYIYKGITLKPVKIIFSWEERDERI
jgi:hypothetical protein